MSDQANGSPGRSSPVTPNATSQRADPNKQRRRLGEAGVVRIAHDGRGNIVGVSRNYESRYYI